MVEASDDGPNADVLVETIEKALGRCHELFTLGRLSLEVAVDEVTNSIFSQPKHKYFFLFKQNFRRTNSPRADRNPGCIKF